MKLATRISRISVSKTMAVMEAAIKLREQGIDVVDFGPGEPDFPTPENVKQAGVRAIQADFTKYTAIGGIKELKKAIVDKHAREFGSKYDICDPVAFAVRSAAIHPTRHDGCVRCATAEPMRARRTCADVRSSGFLEPQPGSCLDWK